MVELRKRKAPAPLPVPEKKSKNPRRPRNATKEEPANGTDASHTGSPSGNVRPTVGQTIDLDGFGGEIETNDGTKTTLKALVDASKSGVVLFTYPRASTPGCKLGFLLSSSPLSDRLLAPIYQGWRPAVLLRSWVALEAFAPPLHNLVAKALQTVPNCPL